MAQRKHLPTTRTDGPTSLATLPEHETAPSHGTPRPRAGTASPPSLMQQPAGILALQRTAGNRAVQRQLRAGRARPARIQRFFKFTINSDTYAIQSATYIRSPRILTQVGRIQGKHTTADVAQRPAFAMYFREGVLLDKAAADFLEVAKTYCELPGLNLKDFRKAKTGKEDDINGPMQEASDELDRLLADSKNEQQTLAAAIQTFQMIDFDNKMQEQAAAFKMHTSLERLIDITERLRDLIPLTNLWSQNETRGGEPEAMGVLEPLELALLGGGNVADEQGARDKLWDLFDFDAIELLLGEPDEQSVSYAVADVLPWLDFEKLMADSGENVIDAAHIIVAHMLAQHVRQMQVSFRSLSDQVQIGARENVRTILEGANPGGLDIDKVLIYMYDVDAAPLEDIPEEVEDMVI